MRRTLGQAERRLLLSVLDLRAPLALASTDRLNWPAVIAAARGAKILPALAQRALVDAERVSDPSARVALREALQETAVYNTRLLAELARCVALLRAAGIEHVVLKGAALLARDYPRLAMRHTVDFDLLVDPERFDAGVALLRAAGYIAAPHTQRLAPDGRTLAESLPSLVYACAPLKGPSGVNADLHRRVPTTGFEASGGFRGWHFRAQAVEVQGVTLRLCHPSDLALHLCEHFALQHHADPADVPRLLCDLRALFPDAPPWRALRAGGPGQRAAVSLAQMLYVAAFERAAARDPATELLQRVAIADPALMPLLSAVSHLRGHASRIVHDALRRPGYALRTWFPTRAYLAQRYGIAARSPRVYSLYVSRLVVAALRGLRPPP